MTMYLTTGRAIDPGWLLSRKWPSVPWYTVLRIARDACKADRKDLLEWLMHNVDSNFYRVHVLQSVAQHSLAHLTHLISDRIDTIAGNSFMVDHLYMGAYHNPDEDCLFYLDSCNIFPSHLVPLRGVNYIVSMCGLHSHARYLQHLVSSGKVLLSTLHFTDFMKFADVPCMQILIDTCGARILLLYKSRPANLLQVMRQFNGSMEAHRLVVQFLLSLSSGDKPEVTIIKCLMDMLRNAFLRLPHLIDKNDVEDVIQEMRSVDSDFQRLRDIYYELDSTAVRLEYLLPPEWHWLDMLPKGPACKELAKFLITYMGVSPLQFKVNLQNCVWSPGLLQYMKSVTVRPYNPIIVESVRPLLNVSPQDILRSADMIQTGEFPVAVLKEYCDRKQDCQTMDLKDILAHNVLSRVVNNISVLKIFPASCTSDKLALAVAGGAIHGNV